MRVHLKGINNHTAKLADGTTKTYWYAWKGGPRLRGEPGTPEFIASYNEAAAQKIKTPTGLLFSLLQAYQDSEDFRQLAPRTRDDYKRIIQKEIEPEYSDFPLSGLTDRRTRGIFMEWRDKLALRSRRQADYAWTVLARVLSWSKDRGKITVNPCERGGRIYSGSRSENVWSAEQEAAFLKSAPSHPIVLTTIEGKPWTAAGFRASWAKACTKSGVSGVTFNDLRGTAVTRLALAECTEAEIATITGHSLRDVRSILDAHYLHRDPALGESAIRKLEKRTETSK